MGQSWVQVIGVVGDIKEYGLDKQPADAIYISTGQQALGDGSLIVKTAGAQAHQFDLPNVLFVGKKKHMIEDMLKKQTVVDAR